MWTSKSEACKAKDKSCGQKILINIHSLLGRIFAFEGEINTIRVLFRIETTKQ